LNLEKFFPSHISELGFLWNLCSYSQDGIVYADPFASISFADIVALDCPLLFSLEFFTSSSSLKLNLNNAGIMSPSVFHTIYSRSF